MNTFCHAFPNHHRRKIRLLSKAMQKKSKRNQRNSRRLKLPFPLNLECDANHVPKVNMKIVSKVRLCSRTHFLWLKYLIMWKNAFHSAVLCTFFSLFLGPIATMAATHFFSHSPKQIDRWTSFHSSAIFYCMFFRCLQFPLNSLYAFDAIAAGRRDNDNKRLDRDTKCLKQIERKLRKRKKKESMGSAVKHYIIHVTKSNR